MEIDFKYFNCEAFGNDESWLDDLRSFGLVQQSVLWKVNFAVGNRVICSCLNTQEKITLTRNVQTIRVVYYCMSSEPDCIIEININKLPEDNFWRRYFTTRLDAENQSATDLSSE